MEIRFWCQVFLVLLWSSVCTAQLRKCRNPSCNEAISIVRAFRDYQDPNSVFQFNALSTFAVLSKQGDVWEADVRIFVKRNSNFHLG
jgi:hypothetical protein